MASYRPFILLFFIADQTHFRLTKLPIPADDLYVAARVRCRRVFFFSALLCESECVALK